MHDAIVIGAGPAGCVAAILLARGGWRVRLVEQHRYPRDKVCGECLSAVGFKVLSRLGLADQFIESLLPIRITRTRIHSSDGGELKMNLPRPMWGISRSRLDAWMLAKARDRGVSIHQPARCERLTPGDRPSVEVRGLTENRVETIDADVMLLADGKGALLPSRPAATTDLGVKAHFDSVAGSRDAIALFGVDGHYGGVAPIENGLWNVAFSVPRERVRSHDGDLDALFATILQENKSLASAFTSSRRVDPWLTSPLPRASVATRWPRGVIPIGNAAAAIEPIGGEGMGLAMRSAELAATMLIADRFDPVRLRSQFRRLWRYRSFACRAVAKAVSHRQFASLTLPLLRPIPSRWLMSAMGK